MLTELVHIISKHFLHSMWIDFPNPVTEGVGTCIWQDKISQYHTALDLKSIATKGVSW